ncbi:MAG: hypothetical protein ABII01_05940 [Candidatus Woesearchaeota archaeon]
MVQNRNKLIDLFIGNISNAIVHEILEKAIDDDNIRRHYDKEMKNSFEIAKKYRENINPAKAPLPDRDNKYIRDRIVKKVNAELQLRISKGYENIDISLVGEIVDKLLKEMSIE